MKEAIPMEPEKAPFSDFAQTWDEFDWTPQESKMSEDRIASYVHNNIPGDHEKIIDAIKSSGVVPKWLNDAYTKDTQG